MMLSASNALVRDGVAYLKLKRFSSALNGGRDPAAMAVLVLPPVFDLVAAGGHGPRARRRPPGRAIDDLPHPLAGCHRVRRFYQGILISHGRPQAVTWGTAIAFRPWPRPASCSP